MSYSLGIAIVVLLAEQNVILQNVLVHGWNIALAATTPSRCRAGL
jgi:hypothetical protein